MSENKKEELLKQREEMRKEKQESKELLAKLIEIKEKGKRVPSSTSTEIKEEPEEQKPENPTGNSENINTENKEEPINVDPQEEQTKNESAETPALNEPEEIETIVPKSPAGAKEEPKEEVLEGNTETKEEREEREKQENEEKAKLERGQKIKELESEILSISLKMPFGESIEKNEELYEKMKRETIPEFAPLVEFAYKQLESLKRMGELKSELEQIKGPETPIIKNYENKNTKSVKNKILNIFNKKGVENTETPKENIPKEENTPAPEKTEKKKIGARIFGFVKNIFKNKKEEKLNDTETERKENGNFLWIKKENKEKYAFFETEIDGQKIKLEISEQKGVLYNKFLSFFSKEFESDWKLSLTNFFDDKLYEHTPYVNNVKYFFYDSVLHKNAKKEITALAESIKNEILNIKSEEKENKEEKIKKLIEEIKNIQTNTIWKEIEKIKKLKEVKFKFIATDYMHKINIDTAKTLAKKYKVSPLYLTSIEELSPEVVDILISSNNYETIEFLNLKTDKLSDKTIEMLGKFQGKYESVNSSLKKFLEYTQEKYREDQKNKNN